MTHEQNCNQNSRLGRLEDCMGRLDKRLRDVETWQGEVGEKLTNIEKLVTDIKVLQAKNSLDKGTLAYIILGLVGASFISGLVGVTLSIWINGGGP